MNCLFVVNPSVASYREGLYDRLRLELAEEDIHLQVVGHASPPSIAQRDDSIEAPWVVEGSVRWVTVAARRSPSAITVGYISGRVTSSLFSRP